VRRRRLVLHRVRYFGSGIFSGLMSRLGTNAARCTGGSAIPAEHCGNSGNALRPPSYLSNKSS